MWRRTPTLAIVALFALAEPAAAEWLSRLVLIGEKSAAKVGSRAVGALDEAAAAAKIMANSSKAPPTIAVTVGQEGHWTLVSKAGEKITAGSPEEFARALKVLTPENDTSSKLRIVVTKDAVLDHPARLGDLPKHAELHLALTRDRTLPLQRRTIDGRPQLTADLGPSLSILLTDRTAFHEVMAFLDRRIDVRRTRVISLADDGPQSLPRYGGALPTTGTRRLAAEPLAPLKLADELRRLSGQTVFVSGRLDAGQLHYLGQGGLERTLNWSDLALAAAANDVNLIALASSAGRQPGTRNWAFQRIEVAGLEIPAGGEIMADTIGKLAGRNSRLVLRSTTDVSGRVTVTAVPVRPTLGDGATDSVTGWLADVASDLVGKVVTEGIQAEVKSEERDRELDARIVPGLPSWLQFSYLASLLTGLIGAPASRHWWLRIWPNEQRAEYRGAVGYHSARAVRSLGFLAIFAPLVSPVAAPLVILKALWTQVTAPFRFLGRLIIRWSGTTA